LWGWPLGSVTAYSVVRQELQDISPEIANPASDLYPRHPAAAVAILRQCVNGRLEDRCDLGRGCDRRQFLRCEHFRHDILSTRHAIV
jgi:hypothetical protein